ncbi:reverse transcriptase domain, reverse transcriptase zinc-binding domain protein [Tanacetum coccineum]
MYHSDVEELICNNSNYVMCDLACLGTSFILVVGGRQWFNVTLKRVVLNGLFKGIYVGNEEVPISHLQYADDMLIFDEWNVANAKNLMRILECLQQAFDLKINSNKSKVYGIGVSNVEVDFIANRMGRSPGRMPFTYLGIPIGTNMRRIASWNEIIDKF